MKFVASQGGPKVPADTAVTATVGIGPRSEGGFGLDIALEVSLPGVSRPEAEELVAKAHEVCPYSNATRNNVDVPPDGGVMADGPPPTTIGGPATDHRA